LKLSTGSKDINYYFNFIFYYRKDEAYYLTQSVQGALQEEGSLRNQHSEGQNPTGQEPDQIRGLHVAYDGVAWPVALEARVHPLREETGKDLEGKAGPGPSHPGEETEAGGQDAHGAEGEVHL